VRPAGCKLSGGGPEVARSTPEPGMRPRRKLACKFTCVRWRGSERQIGNFHPLLASHSKASSSWMVAHLMGRLRNPRRMMNIRKLRSLATADPTRFAQYRSDCSSCICNKLPLSVRIGLPPLAILDPTRLDFRDRGNAGSPSDALRPSSAQHSLVEMIAHGPNFSLSLSGRLNVAR